MMAFNKNKALESALKYLNQGKVAQAIGEYQQILRQDAKDQATLMTVGDLFARQGDMAQAVEYFERLAQVYLSDGFNSKAIAIYKKIAKLAPAELAPLERLADLYVQQGVLSEARPLFLQIAEAHLKANRAPKAVEALHRLLEVEPENPRVQMRLAELYGVMGQKKEAAQTYLNYAQRLSDRGEAEESRNLIERALEVEPGNAVALLMKAKSFATGNKPEQAIAILESHPEADAGGEITTMLLDLELKSGQIQKAAEVARKQMARGQEHCASLHKVADFLIANGQPADALPLLRELRGPMIEAGEQDKFQNSLSAVTDRLPDNIEALEMLADFCRTTSDSLHLSDAISRLSDLYAATGNFGRAEELLQELIERNKNDERLVERLTQLRARTPGGEMPLAAAGVSEAAEEDDADAEQPAQAPPVVAEEELDEETQRYISQALTDVDLFSSYGLTQKATHLLESVLERAPRHSPTLERLLDLYLGAGNDRRTAELASQLEQIHIERGDTVNSERFAGLRQRYQKAAGIATEDLPVAPPMIPHSAPAASPEPQESVASASVESAPADVIAAKPAAAATVEFEIPLVPLEPEPVEASESADAPPLSAAPAPVAHAAPSGEEVDLSDEWEAMVNDVEVTDQPVAAEASAIAEHEPVIEIEETPVASEEDTAPEPEQIPEATEGPRTGPTIELLPEEPADVPEEAPAGSADFELELTPQPLTESVTTTEDFISELVAEVDDMEAPATMPAAAFTEAPTAAIPSPLGVASPLVSGANGSAPEPTAEILNQLAEVFEEFRSELGELSEEEDEDLETHYNLGIAYREMGLLDEAIGEFQKVAKAVQKGKPFPYAMNCSTMLALSFMDKGEPKIASLWYQRALEVPRLEQETILALRYDLGIALETAGESSAALDSFRQVYAMNIDYRDVAGRIAALQKS